MIKLKYISPDLFIDRDVAVIGNSSNILDTGYGKIIDEFEEVIRFNRSPIFTGDKQTVHWSIGTKETLRIVNNGVFDSCEGYAEDDQYFIQKLRDQRVLYIGPDIIPWTNRNKILDSSCEPFLFDYSVMEKFKEYYELEKNASIGLTTILILIQSGIIPQCFGFDTEPEKPRSHWYQQRPPASGVHGVEREKEIIKSLDEQGLIKLYM